MIFSPHLPNVKYLSFIDSSSRHYNLGLDEQSPHMTTFACWFDRYRYKRSPYRAAPGGDIFQCKVDKIFKDLPNVFGIADDILVVY